MPKKLEIEQGTRFGSLTVIREGDKRRGRRHFYCLCACGGVAEVALGHLRSGHTASCGCLAGEAHGGRHTPLYQVWWSMKQRCHDKNSISFGYYGGRGITVSDEWQSYTKFRDDMGAGYKRGLQIDRVDNDGPYSKENCRWVTRSENGRNKRNNRLITFNNETRCLAEWAELLDIKYTTLHARLDKGWSVERALGKIT